MPREHATNKTTTKNNAIALLIKSFSVFAFDSSVKSFLFLRYEQALTIPYIILATTATKTPR